MQTFKLSAMNRSYLRLANKAGSRTTVLSKRFEQRLRGLQIGGSEAFSEAAVNGREQLARLAGAAFSMPEPGVATRSSHVLGPRKRTERMLQELTNGKHEVAIKDGDSARLYAPVGLDIGASTPAEIALSVIAEMRAVIAGRDGGQLRHRHAPIHDGQDITDRASLNGCSTFDLTHHCWQPGDYDGCEHPPHQFA